MVQNLNKHMCIDYSDLSYIIMYSTIITDRIINIDIIVDLNNIEHNNVHQTNRYRLPI